MTSPTPNHPTSPPLPPLLPPLPPGEGRGEGLATRTTPTKPTPNGFTLIEMIVVLVILGLTSALVLTHAPQRGGTLDLQAATSLVTGTLRTARSRAMVADRSIPVRFDAAALQLGTDPIRPLPPGIRVATAAAILFRPDGSSSGGAVDLTGRADRAHIAVNWLTGRIAVSAVNTP